MIGPLEIPFVQESKHNGKYGSIVGLFSDVVKDTMCCSYCPLSTNLKIFLGMVALIKTTFLREELMPKARCCCISETHELFRSFKIIYLCKINTKVALHSLACTGFS